ncbi:hypothetical protein QFZ63_007107 [Streptomyces sp. B3I7]|nr:hypothetical protein [Streptomyces sp. B3I7]
MSALADHHPPLHPPLDLANGRVKVAWERQNVMRAARYHEYGSVETLVVEQAPDPRPGPGEIRIRVAAAGVNPVDWKVRSGAVREVLPVELPAISRA